MKIYQDEARNERTALDIIAVRATYSQGFGSNAAYYQGLTYDFQVKIITKKYAPKLPTIKRPLENQWKSDAAGRRHYTSEWIAV